MGTGPRLVPKVRRRLRLLVHGPPPPPPPPPVVHTDGMVEHLGARWITGWVAVHVDEPAVRVSLRVNNVEVTATWATSDPGKRNDWGEVRGFAIHVRDVWRYIGRRDRVTIRVNGRPLPIFEQGMFMRPRNNGEFSFAELREELAAGKVFSQIGVLQLSKTLDLAWQAQVMSLYARVRALVAQVHGWEVFFVYGTLLGAVREGGVIGHDVDFDAAFISPHADPVDAAMELRNVAFTLIDAGLDVECYSTALHIRDLSDPDARMDLFHLYFEEGGRLRFPFGVAGTTEFRVEDWAGTEEIDFIGARGLIPMNAEVLTEHIYGAGWRQPSPGFDWPRERTDQALEAFLPPETVQEVYWANFYAHTSYPTGSSFATAIDARPDTPPTVIDIGCGDGRDSFTFARSGRRVTGLDRSHIAIRHASDTATTLALSDRARFRTCDVADPADLHTALSDAMAFGAGTPVLFYLRFFLHSITEEVQTTLLNGIAATARPGDMIAAEFRSEPDEDRPKTHLKHYRRYQNGSALADTLHDEYGFTVLDQIESTGLARYGDEDPVIYRIIARR